WIYGRRPVRDHLLHLLVAFTGLLGGASPCLRAGLDQPLHHGQEQFLFAGKVRIDRTGGHARLTGDLRYRRTRVTTIGKHRGGCVQQRLAGALTSLPADSDHVRALLEWTTGTSGAQAVPRACPCSVGWMVSGVGAK